MGKPSIFSSNYKRRMRRRRILIALITVCVISAVTATWLLTKNGFKKKITDIKTDFLTKENERSKQINDESKNKDNLNKKQSEAKTPVQKTPEQKKEEGYELTLANGTKIKVVYEGQREEKKFKHIVPLESKTQYDISPNGKAVVVFDDKIQRIKYMDISGKVTDITRNQYVSTSGNVVINHDEWLQSKPDYIWCTSPKFIDDNNIAYISQLPWLNKSTKYIWITNIQGSNHVYVQTVNGESIKFNNIDPKGLSTAIDGNIFYLKSTGEVVK
ncbi:hypothetical protein [Clostridium sp. BSD9I1]|uniref:hypothetical protein n=1 Tax=Clostridium sp. BSD9I1 TaxID=2003589 RepID=UPI001649757F|nr:hypothetical protein [Clostridium sp. BSD9I1]